MVALALGVKVVVQVLCGGVLPVLATRVQVALENPPLAALNVTSPDGFAVALAAVFVTVTVQVVAAPTVTVDGTQVTAVVVEAPPDTVVAPVAVFSRNVPLHAAPPGTQSLMFEFVAVLARASARRPIVAPDATPIEASVMPASMLDAAPLLHVVTAHRCCAEPTVVNVPSGFSSCTVARPCASKRIQMRASTFVPPVVSTSTEKPSLVTRFLFDGMTESKRTYTLVPSAASHTLVMSVEPPPASVVESVNCAVTLAQSAKLPSIVIAVAAAVVPRALRTCATNSATMTKMRRRGALCRSNSSAIPHGPSRATVCSPRFQAEPRAGGTVSSDRPRTFGRGGNRPGESPVPDPGL